LIEKTISHVDTAHQLIRDRQIRRHKIDHEGFRQFSCALRDFEYSLGESRGDDFWRPLLGRLRSYRFQLSAAPLPFNCPYLMSEKVLEDLDRNTLLTLQLYPEFMEPAISLISELRYLTYLPQNPLLDKIASFGSGSISSALLIKEPRLKELIRQELHEKDLVYTLVTQHQMRELKFYDHLVVVGPDNWYDDFIFEAPRAPRIDIVAYSWFREKGRTPNVFVETSGLSSGESGGPLSSEESPRAGLRLVEADDILPKIDLTLVSGQISARSVSAEQDRLLAVPARAILLAGDAVVFLEPGGSVLVVDLEGDEHDRILRLNADLLEPGVFLLLRASGGGDLIIPLADRILGSHTIDLRKMQLHWKVKLREAVRKQGMAAVIHRLSELGGTRSNEVNVRNWMTEKTIKTRDFADFAAVMRFIGEASRTDQFWRAMEVINRAHRKAGNYLRRRLLRLVQNSDLGPLRADGMMSFELEEGEGGSFVAYRVETIGKDLHEVSPQHLGQAFSLGDGFWQE
jgi:hypothetical protein